MSAFGSILARYVFRQTAGAVLLILLSLTGVVWIALALRQLNLVTSQGQEIWLFIKMTLLALPNLMALIAPIALLVATIHVLNRLNGDSELIVMTAGGGTVWTIARPLLLVAVLVAVAVSVVNHWAMPWSLRLLREYVIQVRTDLITQVIQPGRFTSPEPSLTFHIRDRSLDGELQGLVMHDGRDGKQVTTFLAERGRILEQDGDAYLLMEDGHILRRSGPDDPVRIVVFRRYAVDLTRFEAKEQGSDLKPRERYLHELIRPNPSDQLALRQPGLLRSELHERLASPLYPFVFVLIAVAFIGRAKTTRQNRVEAIVIAFLLAAGCRLAGLAGNNVVTLRASAVWIVYAIPLVAMLLAIIALQVRTQRRRSRLARAAMRTVDGLAALLPGRSAVLAAPTRPAGRARH
jgi:lipopolysaccharide export system permease protein